MKKECPEFTCAVAVVKYQDRYLLGLAKNRDDRDGKWCAPGGHLKRGEDPKKAAVRECREETGITCTATSSDVFTIPDKPHVAFVACKASSMSGLKPNNEFSALGFFKLDELDSLELYKTVKPTIKKAF